MDERKVKDDRMPATTLDQAGRRGVRLAVALIIGVVALVYANSLHGPFILDDLPNIVENDALRSFWPLHHLFADAPVGIAGRPIVILSLALNYAVSGEEVWSYHALNVLIHILSALTLLGIVRRTLLATPLRASFGSAATPLGTASALIWAVHPLQTQSVTYIIQRCESLMGLFFLLTFYCAIRGWQSAHPRRWHAAAVAACLAGVGSKEVIAAAPPLVWLYDRMFVHRATRETLARSWGLYAGLVGCLALLAIQVGLAGMGALGLERLSITPLQYALTQPGVVLHYLRLAFWPHPLVLDYEWPIAQPAQAIVPGLILLALALGTAWACVRTRPVGFLGAWFFIILAPTSSVIPIRDLAFEQRMYLPLAAVVALVVAGAYALGRRWTSAAAARAGVPAGVPASVPAGVLAGVLVTGALGYATLDRNRDYRSELSIWSDTVRKRPLNAGAHLNLGAALEAVGRLDEAREHTQRAVRLNPGSAEAKNNLGCLLARQGDPSAAVALLSEAVRLDPEYAAAQYNLGNVLYQAGRMAEAEAHYRRALEIRPTYVDAMRSLGRVLRAAGRLTEATECYRQILRLVPQDAETHYALGAALLRAGRLNEALASFRTAVQLDPDWLAPQNAEAWILATHPDPAVRNAPAAIRAAEGLAQRTGHQDAGMLDTLAAAYAAAGRYDEAVRIAERAAALAIAAGSEALAQVIRERLALYAQGRPFLCAAAPAATGS